ncbi:MAG: 2,3-bisphosphoglycerate-independent phosphoglycerate mutase [Candidatus Magasanikbacteria bacterium]|jgi:2,3-bisphosphoglycerate-independent phosphoglycerate mutase|nr:2,3-bisphosphoglycerate-independent phosphoglycerate mutase [Candidatus Magasanikbacteria bacterium]MBT4315233.1 2,3-bisphosphoglycerate-independent phosphoglycerate mutase [Candidatus Magasanikbacteria bacterium]MBT4547121.1 2,3-bisphosphoglycerate-independent phosphoglycerate mutase [Candidatus Magasanikbacteria bacterium]
MIKKDVKNKPTILLILDGFGLADPKNPGNAITPETAPHIFEYIKKYPSSELKTYGEYVGLFKGQQGNSEAGHMNIGAGRIIKQDLVQISDAIHDGTFYKKEAFKQAVHHVKKYGTAVHVMGMLTDGNSAHAYPEHLYAMLEYFRREEVEKVYLHLFTDGRDSSPHGAAEFLRELRGHMLAHEKIATIMGRFYAMDRNKIWKRIQKAYDAMVLGKGCVATSAEDALSQSYNRDETDEFICPTVIVENEPSTGSGQAKPVATINDNDAIFFINARSDRAREITKVFVQKDFNKKNKGAFRRTKTPKNIRFVAMTDFGPDLDTVMTAFPSPDLDDTLPMGLKGKRQLYIAESEKYAHVTYFINGGYADHVAGEIRMKIDSKIVLNYKEKPEMSAVEITDEVIRYMDKVDFICINLANVDMVGHTGDVKAAKKAVKIVDECVAKITEALLTKDGQMLITADHGNADKMVDLKTKEMMTGHTVNPVPCIFVANNIKNIKMKNGTLIDVAPTIFKMMKVDKPEKMTGRSLI